MNHKFYSWEGHFRLQPHSPLLLSQRVWYPMPTNTCFLRWRLEQEGTWESVNPMPSLSRDANKAALVKNFKKGPINNVISFAPSINTYLYPPIPQYSTPLLITNIILPQLSPFAYKMFFQYTSFKSDKCYMSVNVSGNLPLLSGYHFITCYLKFDHKLS